MKLGKRGGDAWEKGMCAQRSLENFSYTMFRGLENFSYTEFYILRFKGLGRNMQQQFTR